MNDERTTSCRCLESIGAIVVGAVIGGVLALLFAPKRGEELREDIREGATKLGGRVTDAGHQAADKVKDTYQTTVESARGAVETAVDKAQSAIHDKAEQIAEAACDKPEGV